MRGATEPRYDGGVDGQPVLMLVQDLLLRQLVEEGLKAGGYAPIGAAGPTRMRERLETHDVAAIVIDLEATSFDAPSLIGELRAAPETAVLPILGLCGHTNRDARRSALAAGCTRVVTRGEVASRLDQLVAALIAG